MNNVMMISENLLKTYTAINENVQSDELRFCILQAQTIFIRESLGDNLFAKILDLIDTNDIMLPANAKYKTLLDTYIQPTLISYSYYLGLDNFAVKWVSVGLVSNRSEQGNPVDFKMFQYMKSNAKNQAEFNDNLLRRHLIFRSGDYPEYTSGNLNDGQLSPETKSPFKASLTLPGAGYYWKKGRGAVGYLCGDSPFPTWYSSANNSPGAHS